MADYVYSKQLGSEAGVRFELDIVKESNTEYRPIVTAYDEDETWMGCSERRSFGNEKLALGFFNENESKLMQEARQDLLCYKKKHA